MGLINYETLKKFCATSDLRKSLMEPHSLGRYWCATNTVIMILAHKSCCEDGIPRPNERKIGKLPKISGILDPKKYKPQYSVSLSALTKALSKVPLEKEYREEELKAQLMECSACDGNGNIQNEVRFRGNIYEYFGECPICHGYGIVSVSEEYNPDNFSNPYDFIDKKKFETGRMIPEDDANIVIVDSKFRATLIQTVVDVMNILDANESSLMMQEYGIATFRIDKVYIVVCSNKLETQSDPHLELTAIS